ncbi:MAG: ribosome maturation factor RimP [Nocardioidaceae bacterium]
MSIESMRESLTATLVPPLAAVGLDVEAVELTAAGRRRLLRVAVDKDGGLTLDDVADATREVSRLLDESELMGDHSYTLEVTSPGVDRPLTLARHWRRNVDRLVKVRQSDGTSYAGRILAADDEGATVEVDGTKHRIPYADVAKAHIEIEFNRKES